MTSNRMHIINNVAPTVQYHFILIFEAVNMNTTSFYGDRKATKVTTLAEVHDMVDSSDNVLSVVVLPPDAGDNENQVSDEEELRDDPETAHEPAGILVVEEDIEDDPQEQITYQRSERRWKKSSEFDSSMKSTALQKSDDLLHLDRISPLSVWQHFFTDDMIDHIVRHTNLYATRDCNNVTFTVTANEIRIFLGILLLSGYHQLPHIADYWSTQPDLGVSAVYNVMPRNRFTEIKRYLHLADNQNLQAGDKFSKISPIYELLNDQLVKFGIFSELLSIDESMVPYYGKHSCKMFIKGKPIRFGYKLWCICGNDGYPYHVIPYQGKEASDNSTPLGTRVVNKLMRVIQDNSEVTQHQLFFDNFFSSYKLMSILACQSVRAVGTVRENRINHATDNMKTNKELKKSGRGSYDYRSDGLVYVAKWNDNSIVTICSNYSTHFPVHKCKRRVKGATMDVSQPHLISMYNKGMGGVDLLDRLLAAYRPTIRGKKWYWPLFTNILNISMISAWRAHCHSTPHSLSHLEFLRHVTLALLHHDTPSTARVPRDCARVPFPVLESRFDRMNHIMITGTQGRCKVCQKNTKMHCQKCKIRLHAERGRTCFKDFHTSA